MKKAIIAAALVAFSFSSVAKAEAVEGVYEAYKDWVQSDKNYWAKGGQTKAVSVKLKTNAGDLLDVKQLGRGGVPGAMFAVGTYAASVIWEDELNELNDKSLFELFMGDNQPEAMYEDDGSYEYGYFYYTGNRWFSGPTKSASCARYAAQSGATETSVSGNSCVYFGKARAEIMKTDCSTSLVDDSGCSLGANEMFANDPAYIRTESNKLVPVDTSLTFPYNNGFSAFTNDEGEDVIITAEPNSLGGIDITTTRTTENADGEEVTQDSTIKMNEEGEIVSTSTGPTRLNVNVSNPVNFDIPDDYARENTLSSIKDILSSDVTPDSPHYDNVINKFGVVEDAINDQEAPLISLPTIPVAFAGAESCTGIDVDFNVGVFKMQATFDKHCDIARDVINPILKWLFGFLAAWYCWTTYKDETTRSI